MLLKNNFIWSLSFLASPVPSPPLNFLVFILLPLVSSLYRCLSSRSIPLHLCVLLYRCLSSPSIPLHLCVLLVLFARPDSLPRSPHLSTGVNEAFIANLATWFAYLDVCAHSMMCMFSHLHYQLPFLPHSLPPSPLFSPSLIVSSPLARYHSPPISPTPSTPLLAAAINLFAHPLSPKY